MCACDICHARVGHICLHCNLKYPTVDELVQHQRKRQHYGGHFILEGAADARRRRTPVRFRDPNEEETVDVETGANVLDEAAAAIEAEMDERVAVDDALAAVDGAEEILETNDEDDIVHETETRTDVADVPVTNAAGAGHTAARSRSAATAVQRPGHGGAVVDDNCIVGEHANGG